MNSLRAILAVFHATRRRIVNTRALAWLLPAVLAAGGALPFALRGEGSTESVLKLAVVYPPALIFTVLLVGTLWSAAALGAQDIDNGTFASVIVKPAPASAVWLGKWLGILALNAILLVVAGGALAIAIREIAGQTPATGMLDGHRPFQPDVTTLREEAVARQAALRMRGAPAADLTSLLNTLKAEAYRVPPGHACTWTIPVAAADTRNAARANDWSLQFRFHLAALERTPVNGTWTVSTPGAPDMHIPTAALLDGLHHMPLPSAAYHGAVRVSFSNHADSAATAFFAPANPVTLLRRDSTFTLNLLRAFLLLFCFLAAAAALALAFGSLFSFPVAVFTALAVVLAVTLAHVFASIPPPDHSHEASAPAENAFSHAGEWMLTHIHQCTSATLRLLPLRSLADARHITGRQLAKAIAWLLAAIPACLCLLSSLHLQRREFPP